MLTSALISVRRGMTLWLIEASTIYEDCKSFMGLLPCTTDNLQRKSDANSSDPRSDIPRTVTQHFLLSLPQ